MSERTPDLSLYPTGTSLEGRSLRIDGVDVHELAESFGTPLQVVGIDTVREQAREYLRAFRTRHPDTEVVFASKSLPTASVVDALQRLGCGVDVTTLGELEIALAGGADPDRIVLHGNAKRDVEIARALEVGVGLIVIDGDDDVERLARLATVPTDVLVRVKPGITADTHASVQTGHDRSKFGVERRHIPAMLERIAAVPMLRMRGYHAHLGSQLLDLEQFATMVESLAELGPVDVLNIGGGLGVRYLESDRAPSVDAYADVIVRSVHASFGTDLTLIVEPGRSLVARAGVTLYRVVTVKRGVATHVAVDGGMGDNLEVAIYGQAFEPYLVGDGPIEVVDLVGRHCESGDVLRVDARLARAVPGDLVVVPVTGAYCYSLSNNYNAAPRPALVFVEGGRAREVVRAETLEDLLARDVLSRRAVSAP